jgi:hypothetical protein
VSNHAKILNSILVLRQNMGMDLDLDDMTSELVSVPEEASSHRNGSPSRHSPGTEWQKLNALGSSDPDGELQELKLAYLEVGNRLSENVGHTEAQVTVGALLGFVVSLVVYATL